MASSNALRRLVSSRTALNPSRFIRPAISGQTTAPYSTLLNSVGKPSAGFGAQLRGSSGFGSPNPGFGSLINRRFASHTPTNVSVFFSMKEGIGEIMADYVHNEVTRTWILVCFRLFLIIAIKDGICTLIQ